MHLIPEALCARMLANDRNLPNDDDPFPVVRLFTPGGGATWLLTEIDTDNPDSAFGLCDTGQGFPELGYLSLTEIASIRGPLGLPVERDHSFNPNSRSRFTQRLRAKRALLRRATLCSNTQFINGATPLSVGKYNATGLFFIEV